MHCHRNLSLPRRAQILAMVPSLAAAAAMATERGAIKRIVKSKLGPFIR
jgi:hypothetical protein